jgi:hypothetical protein
MSEQYLGPLTQGWCLHYHGAPLLVGAISAKNWRTVSPTSVSADFMTRFNVRLPVTSRCPDDGLFANFSHIIATWLHVPSVLIVTLQLPWRSKQVALSIQSLLFYFFTNSKPALLTIIAYSHSYLSCLVSLFGVDNGVKRGVLDRAWCDAFIRDFECHAPAGSCWPVNFFRQWSHIERVPEWCRIFFCIQTSVCWISRSC